MGYRVVIVARLATRPKPRCWLLIVFAAVYDHRCVAGRAGGVADDGGDLDRAGSHRAMAGCGRWTLRYYL